MSLVVDTFALISECRQELARFKALSEDFAKANEVTWGFLSGAARIEAESAVTAPSAFSYTFDSGEWRERAEQTRSFAELVCEPRAKRLFLEIADSYDQIADESATVA